MKLNSKRLLLRPISIIDLYDLFQLQSNEKVAQYNTIGIPDDVNFTQTLIENAISDCLLYTSPSPRDLSTSRMPSSA